MKKLILFSIILFIGSNGYTQENLPLTEELQQMTVLNSLNENQLQNLQNNINISQVGDQNQTIARITAKNSDVQFTQNGNYNYISVNANVNSLKGAVIQNGSYNSSFDFVHDQAQNVSLNLIQNGNGHHSEIYGSNSISNELAIEMAGDSQSIIIRNFN